MTANGASSAHVALLAHIGSLNNDQHTLVQNYQLHRHTPSEKMGGRVSLGFPASHFL
jgi:hypothetical protein